MVPLFSSRSTDDGLHFTHFLRLIRNRKHIYAVSCQLSAFQPQSWIHFVMSVQMLNFHCLISSSPRNNGARSRPWQQDTNRMKSRSPKLGRELSWKFSRGMPKRFVTVSLRDEPAKMSKKGTVAGAVALIIGTSIGTGILALPQKTSPAGIVPSSISMITCWAFMLIEALLLVEINVSLLKEKKEKLQDDEFAVVSITTMAQETLGEWGGVLATVTYVFLGYTSMIAYCAKSGEILHHLLNFPESISGVLFTALFTILISVGGTRTTDQVNQWLTVFMIGLLIVIEVIAVFFGWSFGFDGGASSWGKVPATLPIMIFSLAYHDLAPVVCAYLKGNLKLIRASVFIGSLISLLVYLVWNAIALGLSSQAAQDLDPVEFLLSLRWDVIPIMIEAFSLLAVGTSTLCNLLGMSEFIKEQLGISFSESQSTQLQKSDSSYDTQNGWQKRRLSITTMAVIVAPSLVVSITVPDAFSTATDIAGGYCMTVLYGVLPPAMVWAMNRKKGGETKAGFYVVVGAAGIFASGIVLEKIFQDLSWIMNIW